MTKPIDMMRLPAIDVHGHCGVFDGYPEATAHLLNAPAEEVSARAWACAITWTLVSELGAFDVAEDRPSDVDAANRRAQEAAERLDNLLFYAVVNPRREGWQAKTERLLADPRCVGVKLHPCWHFWTPEECGNEVFSFAHERRLIVLTHTGNEGNEPERFIPYADKYPHVKLILAHIGHDDVHDRRDAQINAVRKSTQGNVWADTSSAKSITSRLIEYAVERIGTDRILFGTDTPLYFAAMQKARIAYAQISEVAKRKILYENAAALLPDLPQSRSG